MKKHILIASGYKYSEDYKSPVASADFQIRASLQPVSIGTDLEICASDLLTK